MRLGLLLLAGGWLAGGCGGPATNPEAELRQWLESAEQFAEERDRRSLMRMVSSSYVDDRGNSKDDIEQTVRVYMLRQRSIALVTKIDDIEFAGDSFAKVGLTVGMAGTNNQAFGLSADAYRFSLELERGDGEWLLIGARWAPLGSELR